MKAIFGKKKKNKGRSITDSSQPAPPASEPVASTSTNADPMGPSPFVKPSKATNEAIEIAEQFFGAAKDISEATGVLDPLKSACALMIRGTQSVRASRANQSDWAQLCEDLEAQRIQMEGHRNELQKTSDIDDSACLKALEHYLNVIANVIEIASTGGSRSEKGSLFMNTTLAQMEKEGISRQRERVENAWQTYSTAMHNLIRLKAESIMNQIEGHDAYVGVAPLKQNQDDYGMTGSDFTIAYGDRVDLCEEGTRVEIMECIRRWESDPASHSQIFWLKDAAGTGKSTIAATMAKEWSRTNRLAGRFFFSPNSRTTQTTKEFCRLAAEDVARNQPSVADFIRDTMKAILSEQNFWFDVQLQRLIIEPIMKLEGDRNVIFVVDALDNCELSEERSALLNAIIRHLPSAPRLKILLTSRPIQDIADILSPSPLVRGSDIQLLNIRDSHHPDVALFVEKKLKYLPSDDRAMIIARSGGLFLYAATVCRMLERSRNRLDVLRIVSEVGSTDKLEHRMDILYLSVLKQALVDRGAGDMMLSVLAMIIVAYQPLSSNTIRRFLPKNDYVEDFVQDLGGVLKDGHPDRPIKVLHPTFREFILSNEDRANGFLLHSKHSASEMANACIAILEEILEDDIFHLDRPGHLPPRNEEIDNLEQLIQKSTTAAERYASAFWAHHVSASEMTPELWSRVMGFLSKKYLNWVELMSWRRSIGLCIEGLSHLRRAGRNRSSNIGDTQSKLILHHAHQFLIHHQSLIIESAFHTYGVALLFTPPQSPLFGVYLKRYRLRLPDISNPSSVEWDDHVSLSGHTISVDQILFSPDGSRLITIDIDETIHLWNAETWELVGRPFHAVSTIGPSKARCAFSVTGHRFSFIRRMEALHICYSSTGELVIPLDIQSWKQPAMSPHMTYVLFGSSSSIHRMDLKHGQEPKVISSIEGDATVREIAISPDERMVVYAASSKVGSMTSTRAFLCELNSFRQIASYKLKDNGVRFAIVFSPDSKRFTIYEEDYTLLLCDGETGEHLATLGETVHYRHGIATVIFCPLGSCFAHTRLLESSRIWLREQKKGALIAGLRQHTQPIESISFSPGGERLASISFDQTVRIWSTKTGIAMESIFPGFTGDTHRAVLSHDWSWLALTYASNTNQVVLHNLRDGAVGRSVAEDEDEDESPVRKNFSDYAILGAAYVGSNIIIRSGSDAGAVLWDTDAGRSIKRIAHREYVVRIAFSPNGEMIAVLSESSDVWVLDAKTLTQVKSFRMTYGRARGGGVFFSSDSELLAAYNGGSARIWTLNVKGLPFSYFTRGISEEGWVKLCAISPDNVRVAGVHHGKILHVWQIGVHDKVGVQATIPSYYIEEKELSAAFSPSDPSLLAFHRRSSITLWRVSEELQLIIELSVDKQFHNGFSFSSDGKFLAYGPVCWHIVNPVELLPYYGVSPPISFITSGLHSHSFLFYEDGWVCSAYPKAHLLPIPTELRGMDFVRDWWASGEKIILMNKHGEPLLIDCSLLLAQARRE